ncbi:GNAT family acetyltransferase [Homoserinimonas aerilata]|uniref:GNAT family acetyltransferase n=1 Tax=Homoserinimonas aerilata TaxID=1162970 RepID=A0A542YG84_9MICO|nr:GNAT family N-acetyltransferase [Homoserinimonas aerilata]TQL47073.1 GNAT family acetyltransferase [Homoserinimonas aerilata]
MTVHLVPISVEQFPAWLERSRKEYESDLIESGESPEDARRHAAESLAGEFPAHAPTADNAVFDVVDDAGAVVGYLWVGRDTSGDSRSWWIWDIVIDPEQRGKGLGRATMRLAEEYARSQGASTMGLSVFGFNHTARGLYESLGYETVTVKMRKTI